MSEWINVKEELPQRGILKMIFNQKRHMAYINAKNEWVCPYDHKNIDNVTHWMSLPAPPLPDPELEEVS